MLIGNSSKRPDIKLVRRIKRTLHEGLELPEDAIITVSELACLEEACAPFETVIGLLRSKEPQLQHKIHKPVKDITIQDLVSVCSQWGFEIHISTLEPLFTLHHNSRR